MAQQYPLRIRLSRACGLKLWHWHLPDWPFLDQALASLRIETEIIYHQDLYSGIRLSRACSLKLQY